MDAHTANDTLRLASEVLVFMLVAINQNFKLPIAYYYTDKLSGREKAKLLKNILCTLYEKNLDVVSITFDGASSNISMCQELGAYLRTEIEEIKPYFDHPIDKSKRIYIFYDVCHMIKLVRNIISKYDLTNNENKTISWKFIQQLAFFKRQKNYILRLKLEVDMCISVMKKRK